jgi:putative ABC transport system substrate-binding protein
VAVTSRRAPRLAVLLTWTLLLAPGAAGSPGAAARLGLLGPDEEPRFSEIAAGLRQGLQEQGYREDAVRIVEGRAPRGDATGARAAIASLVGQQVTVLFVIGSGLARLAREAAPGLPVVFVTPGDPVAAGLAASFARPGGNMTAMMFEYPELSAKRLDLLRELAPRIRRVLALYDPRDASPRQGMAAARTAATALGLTLVEREVRHAEDVTRALKGLDGADALLGIPGGVTSAHYQAIIRAANAHRLPTIFHARTRATRDALLTYGASDVDVARQAARMLDKILKGAKAGDLPVERPTKLALVVNLKTAEALRLTVPRPLLLRADQVLR